MKALVLNSLPFLHRRVRITHCPTVTADGWLSKSNTISASLPWDHLSTQQRCVKRLDARSNALLRLILFRLTTSCCWFPWHFTSLWQNILCSSAETKVLLENQSNSFDWHQNVFDWFVSHGQTASSDSNTAVYFIIDQPSDIVLSMCLFGVLRRSKQ